MLGWHEVSARLGRNDMPHALAQAVFVDESLTDPVEIAKGVESSWTMCEWPQQALDDDLWLMLFDLAVGDRDEFYLDEETPSPRSDLPDRLVLYRGAVEGHEYGMSWTTDLARAKWFATRWRTKAPAFVLRIEADRDMIVAHFHGGRREHEWVLDPMDLESYADVYEQDEWDSIPEEEMAS